MFKLGTFRDVVGRFQHDFEILGFVEPVSMLLNGIKKDILHVGLQFYIERLDELGACFNSNGERRRCLLFLFCAAIV